MKFGLAGKFSKAQREWVYGIVATGVPVLALFSTQIAGNASLITGLAAALLGVAGGTLAFANTTPDAPK